ncbi:ribonuclease H [Catovirus CTV1]|uniref:ribonuclease H n=1 Tax=Catovirus CTV1 TaxID=1977631 RepID=A0A1V0SBQ5_9VIRU|nr:ribonuclease H [Catovirus CTV1]
MAEIIVFTDGSYYKTNFGEEKSGYGIYFPNGELENVSRPFTHKPLTNQRSELYAIFKAIYYIITKLKVEKIKIYTDSEYSMKSLTMWIKKWKQNNWKTANGKDVKNSDIINNIDKLMTKFKGKIEFYHVNSHTGKTDDFSKWNDIVDSLAKNGAKQS